MLKKVLKYDFKSVWRYWWIASVIFTAVSLCAPLVMRFFIEFMQYSMENPYAIAGIFGDLFIMFGTFAFLAAIAAIYLSIAAFAMTTPLLTSIRFYSNFFSDRGYLTFTLPVSRRTHLLSKIITAMFWELITLLQIGLGVGYALLVIPPTENGELINPIIYKELFDALEIMFKNMGAWVVVYGLIFVLLLFAMSLYGNSILQFCITFGSTVAKKHKVLASIGTYFVFTFIVSMGSQIVSFCTMFMSMGLDAKLMQASQNELCLLFALFFLLYALAMATVGIIAYCTNLNIIERKLNLA